jgi:2-keto-4-pentenoate hydratase/2-oxohepta-3-ene-1,7-dioic acid hydratase in catechol pathway
VKLALFDDWRLGAVSEDADSVVDITDALPWDHDADPVSASWWRRLCRDFDALHPALEAAASEGTPTSIREGRLRAPVLNPGKVIATASNYGSHVAEMRDSVLERVSGRIDEWLLDFDIFLKATSSVIGPNEAVVLPQGPVQAGKEIHHESELTLVIGRGGVAISEQDALEHVLGYTIGLDMTVRGDGDRSRRKSYDTFTPIGPWIVTRDEVTDPHQLDVGLVVDGEVRQEANTADLLVHLPGIIAYASSVMRLEPGDVILTGAPPGVGPVRAGEVMTASISRIGSMTIPVRGPHDGPS